MGTQCSPRERLCHPRLLRCVAIACTPKEREWVILTAGRGKVSAMMEPGVVQASQWPAGDKRAGEGDDKESVEKECVRRGVVGGTACSIPNYYLAMKVTLRYNDNVVLVRWLL